MRFLKKLSPQKKELCNKSLENEGPTLLNSSSLCKELLLASLLKGRYDYQQLVFVNFYTLFKSYPLLLRKPMDRLSPINH